jgi:hypothetical protein
VRLVQLAQQEPQERLVHKDQPVQLVLRVFKVQRDLQVVKESQEPLEPLVQQVRLVHKDQLVLVELTGAVNG